jgi:hypothetical protein
MPDRPEVVMLWHLLKRLLIFPKGLLGGLIAATLMWAAVIFYDNWQANRNVRKLGYGGPMAVAGGWQYLVQLPWVVVLLSVAFGLGFYLVVSWVARHP